MQTTTDWFHDIKNRLAGPRPLGDILQALSSRLAHRPRRWHACPRRNCRRHHRCASRYLDCATVALSPAQQAVTLAQLQRALGEK